MPALVRLLNVGAEALPYPKDDHSFRAAPPACLPWLRGSGGGGGGREAEKGRRERGGSGGERRVIVERALMKKYIQNVPEDNEYLWSLSCFVVVEADNGRGVGLALRLSKCLASI